MDRSMGGHPAAQQQASQPGVEEEEGGQHDDAMVGGGTPGGAASLACRHVSDGGADLRVPALVCVRAMQQPQCKMM